MFFCNGKNGMCDEKSCTKNYDLCEYYSGNGGETLESGNEKTQCIGLRCPMQVGYKVDECNHKDCPYRTEPITNAQKIRAMSDEELRNWLFQRDCTNIAAFLEHGGMGVMDAVQLLDWLKQSAE